MKREIHEICGDWALDIDNFNGGKMSRYIDADKLYETARKYHKDFAQSIADLTSLREVLEDTPTADVVAVVRCKDCRIARPDIMIDGWYHCDNNDMVHRPDHFCSYGERKDEE